MTIDTPKFSAFLERLIPSLACAGEDCAQPGAGVGYALFHLEGWKFIRGLIGLGEHVDDVPLDARDVGIGQTAFPRRGGEIAIGAREPGLKKQAHHLNGVPGQFGHFLRSILRLEPSDHA